MKSSNPIAEQILLGNYSPGDFQASNVITDHDSIIQGIQKNVDPESLKELIVKLATFKNRNSGSDTNSATTGIGAARKWVYQTFEEISKDNDDRLITSYLNFDQKICNINKHKNIFAVLPGTDTADNKAILIEGHIDSRCAGSCDINCVAEGIEDNASGTALVMELARVMSKYTFKNTLVFMATIGEEQGLYGAKAFAKYVSNNDIEIEAVLNNDVIGGIICGKTSSAPSCPGLNHIDSTQVRFFSFGGYNSKHKQLARYTKLQYKEELLANVKVPMTLTIMSAEDRSGRSGDHIPFREKGMAAIRFTSANEHGNASNGSGYTDRQHTSNDGLGIDTNNDSKIDSFFVDFNYLGRNAVINGISAAMIAIGPQSPDFEVTGFDGHNLIINITDQKQYKQYRVGVRTLTNDWDSVYTINQLTDTIRPPYEENYYVSTASVDSVGIESLFSKEKITKPTGLEEINHEDNHYELLQNRPNPFDEATIIAVKTNLQTPYKKAFIVIKDIQNKIIEKTPIELNNEVNEITFNHGYGKVGVYNYSLVIDGKVIGTRRMVFAN